MSSALRGGRLRPFRRFLNEEAGVISAWSLFLFMTAGAVGAVAVDVTHMFAARTELQVAADMAAHVAIYRRNQRGGTASSAQRDAIAVVAFGMPEAAESDIIRDTDILFGTFDAATDSFTLDPISRRGVLVTASRESGRRNPVATFLFRLAGIEAMDVSASAVGETYTPRCLREGFTANDIIDVQSNNAYCKGFCMHSNSHVEMNSGNAFEAGTVASMPDLGDF